MKIKVNHLAPTEVELIPESASDHFLVGQLTVLVKGAQLDRNGGANPSVALDVLELARAAVRNVR